MGGKKLYENTKIIPGEDIYAPINFVELTYRKGILYDEGGKPAHNCFLFVIDHKSKFLMTNIGPNKYHTQLAKGKPVLWGGEAVVENGKVILINNFSGHYKPDAKDFKKMLSILRKSFPGLTKDVFEATKF